ncbi:hypothetical protein CsatA_024638 [Cannabis sativa]
MRKSVLSLIHKVLVVFLLLSYSATKVRVSGFFIHKTHVAITNYLDSDRADLTVHCKSKDDDLGVHVIPFNSSYEIVFYPSVWDNTLFFCSMKWPETPLVTHWFDIYDEKRDNKQCQSCEHYDWKINRSGPCMFSQNTKQFTICYDWNK